MCAWDWSAYYEFMTAPWGQVDLPQGHHENRPLAERPIIGMSRDGAFPMNERMPAILLPEDYRAWLYRDATPDQLMPLIAAFPADRMTVSRLEDERPVEQPELF